MQIVEDMLLLLTKLIFFFLPHESFASYDDCKLQNGKEIVLDVCVPDRYNKMSPPMEHPTIVQVDFRITGLKRVDLLSNTFSIYMSTYREWQDSRLQIKWNKNETLKYLPNEISAANSLILRVRLVPDETKATQHSDPSFDTIEEFFKGNQN